MMMRRMTSTEENQQKSNPTHPPPPSPAFLHHDVIDDASNHKYTNVTTSAGPGTSPVVLQQQFSNSQNPIEQHVQHQRSLIDNGNSGSTSNTKETSGSSSSSSKVNVNPSNTGTTIGLALSTSTSLPFPINGPFYDQVSRSSCSPSSDLAPSPNKLTDADQHAKLPSATPPLLQRRRLQQQHIYPGSNYIPTDLHHDYPQLLTPTSASSVGTSPTTKSELLPSAPLPARIFQVGINGEQDSLNINDIDNDQNDFIINTESFSSVINGRNNYNRECNVSTDDSASRGTLDSLPLSPTLSNSSLAGTVIPTRRKNSLSLLQQANVDSSNNSHNNNADQPAPPRPKPKKRVAFMRPDMPPRDSANVNSSGISVGSSGGMIGNANMSTTVGGANSRRTSAEPNQTIIHCDDEDGEKVALHADHPRQRQPRVSLHGKPISLRHHRRDQRYRFVHNSKQ